MKEKLKYLAKQENALKITVNVSKQTLYLMLCNKVIRCYAISTSKFGIGNMAGSNKTPTGLHRVISKVGRNARIGSIFKRRRNIKKIARVNKSGGDLITSRILRLEGLQRGVNKGKNIDSFKRCIYIHGTPDERSIGKPASHGCIRMKNRDIIDLFKRVKKGTQVKLIK